MALLIECRSPSPFSFSIFRRHGRGEGEQEATAAQRATRHRAAQERQDRVRRALKQLDRLRAEVAKGSAKTTQRVSCTEPEARVMKQPRQNGPGRTVTRAQEPPAVMRFRARMKTRDAQEVYRTRSQVAEFPHAWIKDKFGLRKFRLRGLVKTGLEALWACLTYNIQQWIRLAWAVRLSSAA